MKRTNWYFRDGRHAVYCPCVACENRRLKRPKRSPSKGVFVVFLLGLAAASAIYLYQNPDLELKVPEGLSAQWEERRSDLRQFSDSLETSEAGSEEKIRTAGRVDSTERVSEMEEKVHAGINAARASNGVAPKLRWVDKLSEVARNHSEDMANRGYFDHDTPEGRDPSERIDRSGYNCWKNNYYEVAENITVVLVDDSLDRMADDAVRSWLTSPGHRTNLLGKQYDRTGVGVSFGRWKGHRAAYVTQVFC